MLMSVCTKIGIQLNCKLGGEAWALEIPVCIHGFCCFYKILLIIFYIAKVSSIVCSEGYYSE